MAPNGSGSDDDFMSLDHEALAKLVGKFYENTSKLTCETWKSCFEEKCEDHALPRDRRAEL